MTMVKGEARIIRKESNDSLKVGETISVTDGADIIIENRGQDPISIIQIEIG